MISKMIYVNRFFLPFNVGPIISTDKPNFPPDLIFFKDVEDFLDDVGSSVPLGKWSDAQSEIPPLVGTFIPRMACYAKEALSTCLIAPHIHGQRYKCGFRKNLLDFLFHLQKLLETVGQLSNSTKNLDIRINTRDELLEKWVL